MPRESRPLLTAVLILCAAVMIVYVIAGTGRRMYDLERRMERAEERMDVHIRQHKSWGPDGSVP